MAKRKNPANDGITVKVGRSGSRVVEVALNGERSVEAALRAAGITKKESEEINVNGEEVELDYELEDEDRIILVKNIEGGR